MPAVDVAMAHEGHYQHNAFKNQTDSLLGKHGANYDGVRGSIPLQVTFFVVPMRY